MEERKYSKENFMGSLKDIQKIMRKTTKDLNTLVNVIEKSPSDAKFTGTHPSEFYKNLQHLDNYLEDTAIAIQAQRGEL